MKKPIIFLTITPFLVGLLFSYLIWGSVAESPIVELQDTNQPGLDIAGMVLEVNPPEGIAFPVTYGDLGPSLINAGAIDLESFMSVFKQSGAPLTNNQLNILANGSDEGIVIDRSNAYFLLNFFWAVGLSNQNPILLEGPMMQNGVENVGRFASTGGWTLGTKTPVELYASEPLITLTATQQANLEKAVAQIYRPCCNNPTIFPDCNHGMAMLGFLELMAANDSSVDEMLNAAKYLNAFWFPEQSLHVAMYFQAVEGLGFSEIDPAKITGVDFMSGSGHQQLMAWLESRGYLNTQNSGGANCGV